MAPAGRCAGATGLAWPFATGFTATAGLLMVASFLATGAALAAAALIACRWSCFTSFLAACTLRAGSLAEAETRAAGLRTAGFPGATFFAALLVGVCFRAIGVSLSTSGCSTKFNSHLSRGRRATSQVGQRSAVPLSLHCVSWPRFGVPRASHAHLDGLAAQSCAQFLEAPPWHRCAGVTAITSGPKFRFCSRRTTCCQHNTNFTDFEASGRRKGGIRRGPCLNTRLRCRNNCSQPIPVGAPAGTER